MADRNLTLKLTGGNVIGVKVAKLKPHGVKRPTIIDRDKDGNRIIKKRKTDMGEIFSKFSWITVDDEGDEVTYEKGDILQYEVMPDGSEELVKFPKTTQTVSFSMDNSIPSALANRLLMKEKYEIYTNDPDDRKVLLEEIENAIEKNVQFYVTPFVWKEGSSKMYHAVFQPYMLEDGRFGMTMFTSEGILKLTHTMIVEDEVDKRKVVQTLENLSALLQVA